MESRPLSIALINPPFQYFPGVKGRTLNYARPPLGIASIAAYLRAYLEHPLQVSIIDSAVERIYDEDDLLRTIVPGKPDLIGFSVVTGTRDIVGRLAARLKATLPDSKIVLGGPHMTIFPEDSSPGVDATFFQEGEQSLLEYIDRVVLRNERKAIDGCCQFDQGKLINRGGPRQMIEPLDQIPFPARDLLRKTGYLHSYPHKYRFFTTMMASRGCPYACSFCASQVLWNRRVRYHSAAYVCAEIDHVARDFDVDLVFFEDDTFLANRELSAAIMEHIKNRHPHMKWMCHTRADTIDEELVKKMEQANCVEIQIGVESGSQAVLDKIDKKMKLEDIRRAFKLLHGTKIKSWGTFIIGSEGETKESVRQTIEFAMETDPSYASFIVMLPLPGTRAYEQFKKNGYLSAGSWSEYTWHGKPVFETPWLKAQDLVNFRRLAFRRFFLRPKKLLAILIDVIRAGTLREIIGNFRFWRSVSG